LGVGKPAQSLDQPVAFAPRAGMASHVERVERAVRAAQAKLSPAIRVFHDSQDF